ncbi:thermonuclease family protein (plasmid) [Sphingomonas sp. AAP5]|uniref:thermonuclease family protein n=3 Tax=Pseudomonadota TaxID=1224 RepID=UPI00105735E2|nr:MULTISPECIES: thermonuclease family protein [unclassified Sphingomonas]MBB3588884.1 endonuclease YncB(thermonuclease family) [Sphingomonas sp. BK481]QBM77928.1 thermonuclease family protein [Sphingomonas sp. AAP5]RYD19368.1 MAG: thermonuclease family protein [Xanthomonadaceae bacterium]
MRTILLLAVITLAACGAAEPQAELAHDLTGRARALDGDTVSIDFRFSGADAFERKQLCEIASGCYPCGKLAQDATARMLRSGEATIHLVGNSSYGRPVAVVDVNGSDLGEQLISQGWAVPATKYLSRDRDRAARYMSAYDEARTNKRGAHAGKWIDPEKWRRGERLACERN